MVTKKKPTTKPKMGRPTIKINKGQLEDLLTIDPTAQECADVLHCSVDTLDRFCKREYGITFAELLRQKRSGYNVSLRRTARQMAEKNAAVLIFMLKNQLRWTDNPVPEESAKPSSSTTVVLAEPANMEQFKTGLKNFLEDGGNPSGAEIVQISGTDND